MVGRGGSGGSRSSAYRAQNRRRRILPSLRRGFALILSMAPCHDAQQVSTAEMVKALARRPAALRLFRRLYDRAARADDQEFTAAVERAFRAGDESEMAATATYDLRRR